MTLGRKDRYLALVPQGPMLPAGLMLTEILTATNDAVTRSKLFDPLHIGFGDEINEATIRVRPPPPETWLDLMDLDRFDKSTTVILETRCQTLIGPRDCIVYTAKEPKDTDDIILRNYYAKDLPGPPVLRTMSMCHKLVEMTALLPPVAEPVTK